MRRWPDVEVWVHERGAPHLIDPSRLTASAARLYGDDMERLWGEVVAVPEANMRVLSGGETIGPWRVEYTPGHASHHVCLPARAPAARPSSATSAACASTAARSCRRRRRPTSISSCGTRRSRRSPRGSPSALAVTHFGLYEDVGEHLAAMHEALDRWAALALETDQQSYAAAMVAEMDAGARRDRDPGLPAGDAARHAVARARSLLDEEEPVDLVAVGQTIELPRTQDPGTGLGGAWRVIVRNDDHNTFDHVAHTLARYVPGVTVDGGYAIADQIHNRGQAVVWSGHQEPAELYWEQLNDAGLTMAPLERG